MFNKVKKLILYILYSITYLILISSLIFFTLGAIFILEYTIVGALICLLVSIAIITAINFLTKKIRKKNLLTKPIKCSPPITHNNTPIKETISVENKIHTQFKEPPVILDNNCTNNLSTELAILCHPDLNGLIWLIDGLNKNYSPDKATIINSAFFRFNILRGLEPSAISINLPISKQTSNSIVEKLPYWPDYKAITPEQRWIYLEFLQNPYSKVEIGYVFILYYGLERHLLLGNFEKAFNVIIKLRQVHSNKSFLAYSSSALIISCAIHKRVDYLQKFISCLDDSKLPYVDVSLFLLCLHTFNLDLTPKFLMIYHKSFSFDNNRYIKNNPDIFLSELTKSMVEKIKCEGINIQKYTPDIENLRKLRFGAFANLSLLNENFIDIPNLLTNSKLTSLCNNLLNTAHEQTKIVLRNSRKKLIK